MKRTLPMMPLSRLFLLMLAGTLLFAGALSPARGARIDVDSDIILRGDHRQDSVLMSQGTMHIDSGTQLGNSNAYSVFNGGHLIIGGGVTLAGETLFHDNLLADIAMGAPERTQLGFVTLHQFVTTHFDNALLVGFKDGDHYGATEALQLNDSAQATLTARTRVVSVSRMADAIDMYDNSVLHAEGSHINAVRNGIRMSGATTLILDQAAVSGAASGIVAADNATVSINGGSILGQGHLMVNELPLAGVVAGGKGFLRSPTGVNIHIDGASIRGVGDSAAGIASGSGEATATRIAVKNSVVTGQQHGLRFFHVGPERAVGQSEFSASSTRITSAGNAVIAVDKAARVNLVLTDGTSLQGGAGRALVAGQGSRVNLRMEKGTIDGDIINNGGNVEVALNDHTRWQGGMRRGNALFLGQGTDWTLTSSSTVASLTNQGRIALSDAESARHRLVVGQYTGHDGELHFSSVLAGDASPADKLIITGSSRGHTEVSVTNLGGSGARTLNGLELIHVEGSSPGNFTQKGRITAGVYDYSLHHNTDRSSWFLTSRKRLDSAPDAGIFRPEAGTYLANLEAARTLFVHSRRDRGGERVYINPQTRQPDTTSLWLVQSVKHQRFDDQSAQITTAGHRYVVQAGGELAQWHTEDHQSVQLGLMAGYGNSSSHSRSRVSGYTSRGSVDGYNVGLYGTWNADEARHSGAYVDTWANYSWFNQHISGHDLPTESSPLSGITASAESGYTFPLGRTEHTGMLSDYFVTPSAQLVWMGVNGREVTEHNGTRVDAERTHTYQTRIGVRVFAQELQGYQDQHRADIVPFFEANWIHNAADTAVLMDGDRTQQAGGKDVGEGKAGVEGWFTKALSLWANVGLQRGRKGYQNASASTGIRYAF